MAMSGFICHDDYRSKTAKLTDEELGRLFRALMDYHATGEAVELEGRESIAFDFIRDDIDRTESKYREKCEQNRRNRTSTNDNERQQQSTDDNERTQKKKEKEKEKDKEKDSFIDDDDARAIQTEQNRVLDAAEDAGFLKSNSVRAKLLNLYAAHGLEKMLSALDSCVKHSAPNIAYLEAVLKGEPKKPKGTQPKTVNAQNYEQRDYKTDPDYQAWEDRNQRELEEAIAAMDRKKASSA